MGDPVAAHEEDDHAYRRNHGQRHEDTPEEVAAVGRARRPPKGDEHTPAIQTGVREEAHEDPGQQDARRVRPGCLREEGARQSSGCGGSPVVA